MHELFVPEFVAVEDVLGGCYENDGEMRSGGCVPYLGLDWKRRWKGAVSEGVGHGWKTIPGHVFDCIARPPVHH
jgi:hypothetical protein